MSSTTTRGESLMLSQVASKKRYLGSREILTITDEEWELGIVRMKDRCTKAALLYHAVIEFSNDLCAAPDPLLPGVVQQVLDCCSSIIDAHNPDLG